MQSVKSIGRSTAQRYAVPSDFCRLFSEEMNSLYLLALLLTADQEMAERCFASALRDCRKANGVFRSWAGTWARRAIVQNAIRMTQVVPQGHAAVKGAMSGAAPEISSGAFSAVPTVEPVWGLAAVTSLAPFERFVFVMSVLEAYSDQECRVLLGCLRHEVAEARLRALVRLGQLAEPEQPKTRAHAAAAAQGDGSKFVVQEFSPDVEMAGLRST